MTKKYSAVIIGLGQIGFGFDLNLDKKFILTHSRALSTHDSFTLLYGIDETLEKRKRFEATLGIKTYSTLKELPYEKVDIAVVAVPTKSHLEVVASLESIKPRLIVIEKPCGQNLKEAKEIQLLAKKIGASIFVNYMRRKDPAVIDVKGKILSKSFGAFIGGNVLYSKGIGHNGAHYLSLILDFFGKPSSVTTLRGKADDNFDFSLNWGSYGVTFCAGIEEKASLGEIDLIFENARIRFEQFGEVLSIFEPKEDPLYAGYKRFEPSKVTVIPDHHRYQMHVYNYVAQLMTKLPSEEDFENALAVHEVVEKIRS